MASLAIVGGYVCTGPKVSWNNRGDRIKCSYITATDRIVSTKKLDHPLLIKTRNFFILLKVSGIQGFRDSGVQGFKGSRIQGFKDSRVQGSKWCLILDTGCWMLDAGCWRDTRCRIQDTGCRQPGKLANRQTGPRANGETMPTGACGINIGWAGMNRFSFILAFYMKGSIYHDEMYSCNR